MKPTESIKVNTLQMHYFLEVAKAGSFTSAAKQLYTTQSALSKTILSLERALGMTLFVRSHKKLSLTEAGRHLYEKWEALLTDMDQSIEECRILQNGYTSLLSIGILDSQNPERFAMPYIREFIAANPDIHINMLCYPVQEIRSLILSGHLDVAYTLLYDLEQLESDELNQRIISVCPHNLAMLAVNPLSDKEMLEIEDLKDCDIISISPLYTPSYNGMIDDLCASRGFKPHYVRYTNNALSLLYNLINERDVFICDRNYKGYAMPSFESVQFRPISGTKSGVALIWSKANKKQELLRFLDGLEHTDHPA